MFEDILFDEPDHLGGGQGDSLEDLPKLPGIGRKLPRRGFMGVNKVNVGIALDQGGDLSLIHI